MAGTKARTVVVTGIGGDVGQGVAQALRRHGYAVVGVDAKTEAEWTRACLTDGWFHTVPSADHPLYPMALRAVLDARGADLLVPATEQELQALAGELDPRIVRMGPTDVMGQLLDKWTTAQLMDATDIPFVATALDNADLGWKGRRKPRRKHNSPGTVVQEWLYGDEYTVPVWASKTNRADVRVLPLRRTLRGGATYRCWHEPGRQDRYEYIVDLCVDMAHFLGLHGSFNVQGIWTDRWVPFEVNPRFSSTVGMRDLMGFNDVLWSCQEALGEPVDPMPDIGRARGMRFWQERVQVNGEWRDYASLRRDVTQEP